MRDLIDIIQDYFSHVTISMKGPKDNQDIQGLLVFLGRIVGYEFKFNLIFNSFSVFMNRFEYSKNSDL